MTIQPTPNDFLSLVRKQLGKPDLSFEEAMQQPFASALLDLMSGSLHEPPSTEAAASAPNTLLSSFSQSPSVLGAAIRDTFSLEELSPNAAERSALVAASDVLMLNGSRRLCLTDAARGELLDAAIGGAVYERTLHESVRSDMEDFDEIGKDPVRLPTAWLRSFLVGRFGALDRSPRSELAAALKARQRLRLVSRLPANTPPIAEIERRLAFADLLEPLRLIIGAEGGWNGSTPATDRFVGRKKELAQLRAFVDELSSQSIGESLSRLGSSAASAIGLREKSNLQMVQADGGLGKSALLAKFVLDHALDRKRPFPFAYLDFDRAALDPAQPNLLLIEMARQVGLQFPDAQPEFAALIDDIRQDRRQIQSAETASSSIRDPFANFVEILRKYATMGSRAFLLIFDTLEVVQWNPEVIDRIGSILSEFRHKRLIELRVVASGRADAPELRSAAGLLTADDNILLQPLSVDEAVEMANRLGYSAIGSKWDVTWSKAIAGDTSEGILLKTVRRVLRTRDDVRREPLTVRVAVDLVLQADADKREEVVRDIRELSDKGEASLAARLYQWRILNHVRNHNARKLAWPGLVLRRVTPEIAEKLLAGLCGVPIKDVHDAYDSLAREVWMVDVDSSGLRHRRDLRARTLPLMRATDPELFEDTVRAAVEYFGSLPDKTREDRADWIYQRLLLGADISDVEPDITPDILSQLVGAADDFPQGSEVASFLASRTATTRLSPGEIRSLRPRDALFHLSATSQSIFGLDDVNIDPIAMLISRELAENRETLGSELELWAQALWIKTGFWREVEMPILSTEDVPKAVRRALLYWVARHGSYLPEVAGSSLQHSDLAQTSAAFVGSDIGFRGATQALALARSLQASRAFDEWDERIEHMLSGMKPNSLISMQAALRTAIVFGDKCQRPALDLWLAARRQGARDRVKEPTFSLSELRMMSQLDEEVFSLLPSAEQTDRAFRISNDETVSSALRILEQFLALPAQGAAGDAIKRGLSRVFACRDEDWIIPFGYAAERITEGHYQALLRDRVASYSSSDVSRSGSATPVWSDMLGAMRLADEAGDLPSFTQLVLEQPTRDQRSREDLLLLLESRDHWSDLICGFNGRRKEDLGPHKYEGSSVPPRPPEPGPDKEDPQRGRWGGKSEDGGRALTAVLESTREDIFYFSLIVDSIDGSELEAPVVFYLHDSYPKNVIPIRRIEDGRRAKLHDWNSWGVFSVGVQVKDRTGKWITLELDLSSLSGLPPRFQR